jgi:hypothetical protein
MCIVQCGGIPAWDAVCVSSTIDDATPADLRWLLLVYRVPREPTRLRAMVWRRLKAAGAVYLQSSVAALPDQPRHERVLRTLRREIIDMGGSAQVLRGEALAGATELVAIYNSARDEEYTEIVDKCHDFLTEIQTEIAAAHFTYAELEENDEDLAKLHGWFDKVADRDVLGASGHAQAETSLAKCATALEEFATRVYQSEDNAD